MAALFERHKTGRISFDRVVIETTGLAAPGPILQTLTTDPFLANAVSLDGIVTVADAVVGSGTLDREFEAVSQVALADLVVLSKSDVAAPQDLRMFEARLRSLNPTAQIVRANHGDVPLNSLWGLSGFRSDATPASAEIWLAPRAAASGHELLATFSGLQPVIAPQTMTQTPHDTRIGSASIILDEPIPEEAFDLWLDTLIALRGADILRVKGIVHIEGIETPFVFHGVQHVFDRPVPLRDWPSDAHRSRIVVIARDLTQRELSRSLDMLRRPDPTAAPEADAHPRMSAPKTRPRA
jgi:G3E family GTPase